MRPIGRQLKELWIVGRAARAASPVCLALAVLAAGGCSGGSETPGFPSAQGRTLEEIVESNPIDNGIVVSPTGAVFERGRNRLGFGVFTASGMQISDAEMAIYAAPSGGGRAEGPFPTKIESLQTPPEFESKTVARDPDAAKVVYVANAPLDRAGSWDLLALIKQGNELNAIRIPSITVGGSEKIPAVGAPAPRIHTPTTSDVHGDLSNIDTRVPHDDMHRVDLYDVLGKKPVALVFATPALCQSRTCGPVVDEELQVESEFGDKVSFIHVEVYNHNDPNQGIRPQLRAFGLQTEPWLFVMDRRGIVRTRIEGGFSASELERAVRGVVDSG
jgi:hypothetical protein